MNIKYKEPTQMVTFRCPKSKVTTLKGIIKCKLMEYQIKKTNTNESARHKRIK
jgi:hypothetical protein